MLSNNISFLYFINIKQNALEISSFQYTERTIKEYIMENVTIRRTKFEDLQKIAYIYEQAFGDKTILPKMKRKFKQIIYKTITFMLLES